MILEVFVYAPKASGVIQVRGFTIPEAFAKIPIEAADRGLALMNDGTKVRYEVRVLDNEAN